MTRQREVSITVHDQGRLQSALDWVRGMAGKGLPAGPVRIVLTRPRRSGDQNRLMWALLHDVSDQVEWHGQRLSPEDWKHIFSAAQYRQRVVPGIDGELVVLGQHTSRLTKEQMGELIEIIQSFGADQGVEWSDGQE